MKQIPLTRGHTALVDDEDFDLVNRYRWFTLVHTDRSVTPYAARTVCLPGRVRRNCMMHHLILPKRPGYTVDHINSNGLDNRRCNLRYATREQQMHNQRRRRDKKYGQYRGTDWLSRMGRWRAVIFVQNKRQTIGIFDTEEAAARAFDERARVLHGNYARLNFPEQGGQP